jgi:hypothetical protein
MFNCFYYYLLTHSAIALGWLEYCNSDRNSYYANLRRKNGREKPYNVMIILQYHLVHLLTTSRSSTGLSVMSAGVHGKSSK